MEIIKSVPKNIQLSKDLSHQIPWSTECLTPPLLLKVNSYSSAGLNLQRQVANAFVVQSLAVLLGSGYL